MLGDEVGLLFVYPLIFLSYNLKDSVKFNLVFREGHQETLA